MISILIPIFNTDVRAVVAEIHNQCKAAEIDFEIIGLEDGSSLYYQQVNKELNDLDQVTIKRALRNNGRVSSRQFLANHANFSWLLFLDADVMPVKNSFIRTYLKCIDTENPAVFGGISYSLVKPSQDFMLRWTYGHLKETKSAEKRNRSPYRHVVSANMLINKDLFLKVNSKLSNTYGMDNYFASLLKKQGIKIRHIDNEVEHRGLETNAQYLRKKEQAAESLLSLIENSDFKGSDNQLLKSYLKLKSLGTATHVSKLFLTLKPILTKNLTGPKPNISYLQFYRLGYLCHLATSKHE